MAQEIRFFVSDVSHEFVRIIEWVAAQIIFFKCLKSLFSDRSLWYLSKPEHGLRI